MIDERRKICCGPVYFSEIVFDTCIPVPYGSIIISINQLQYNPEANSNLVEEDHMCHMMMGNGEE